MIENARMAVALGAALGGTDGKKGDIDFRENSSS
jgi:hypothetical protein